MDAIASQQRDLRKIVWATIETKFLIDYISVKKGLLTRYGYKTLHLMCINKFWMIFKITLYCCSIRPYIHTCELFFLSALPVRHWRVRIRYLPSSLRYDRSKFFSQWLPIQILRKSLYYSVHLFFLTSLRIRIICASGNVMVGWAGSGSP